MWFLGDAQVHFSFNFTIKITINVVENNNCVRIENTKEGGQTLTDSGGRGPSTEDIRPQVQGCLPFGDTSYLLLKETGSQTFEIKIFQLFKCW